MKPTSDSKAAKPECIKGRRVRIVGFYNEHGELFGKLHDGDTIRVSVRHADPRHDEFQVTDVLKKIDK